MIDKMFELFVFVGNWDCVKVVVVNGVDVIYFGLECGFNVCVRVMNFMFEEFLDLMKFLYEC